MQKIIREKSLLRRLISTSSGLIEKAYGTEYTDVESLIDMAESEILKVGESKITQGLVSALDIVNKSIEKIDDLYKRKIDVTGVATGFTELDKMTNGWQKEFN